MVVSLCLIFEILSAIFCLHYLYDEKVRADIWTIGLVLIELVWMRILFWLEWNNSLSFLIYPIILLYCAIRFGFSVKKLIINNILCLMLISVLQATIMLMILWGKGKNIMGEQEMLLINGIMFLLVITVLRKLKIEKIARVLQNNDKIIIFSIIAVVVSVLLFVINYKSDRKFSITHYMVLAVSLFLIIVAVIDIGKHKVKTKEVEAELRLHKLYENSFKNLIDDIRAKQHEFDNHINTIYSQHYLYDTYDELIEAQKQYCNSIVRANKYNKLLSKGNPIILGLLYSKFAEAEKLGIEIEYKVRIDELKCAIPVYKIVELLGNLITNAIEALVVQEGGNKLKVVILEQTYEIAIDIGNECKNIDYEKIQNFFVKGYSEKGKGRGYGLYNVKKICEEYNIVLETVIKQEESADYLHFMIIINKPL